jgi:type II secretory pathway pseudopilin PulG
VEILVALAITVIALMGLLSLHTSSIKGNQATQRLTQATVLAERTMEDLRSMSMAQIQTQYGGGVLPITEVGLPAVDDGQVVYSRLLWAQETAADPDLVLIRVEVRWTDDGAEPTPGGFFDHAISLEIIRTKLELL